MKTKFSTLLVFVLILNFETYCQEHMQFKGVSMGLNHTDFVAKLKSLGFVLDNKYLENDNIFFKGEFINEQASIVIMNEGSMVYAIMVNFESTNQWSNLKRLYFSTKELIKSKYGDFDNCIERFAGSYNEGDGNEMSALFLGDCTYKTIWAQNNGNIIVAIMKDAFLGRVSIVYYDKINYSNYKKKQEDKAKNDI